MTRALFARAREVLESVGLGAKADHGIAGSRTASDASSRSA